jgi:hypothetical protein
MVTLNSAPPVCCPDIEACLSLSVASLGVTDPAVCDDACQEMITFFQKLALTSKLQIAAFSLGLAVLVLWCVIAVIYHSELIGLRSFGWQLIIAWVILQLCSLGCQCAVADILRNANYLETARKLEDIECYDKETSKSFAELVGNIRNASAVIVGELTVSCIAIIVGVITWCSWEVKHAKVSSTTSETQSLWGYILELAPAMGEILLLTMEDFIGIYAFYVLTNPSNIIILGLSLAHCQQLSCVQFVAGARQNAFSSVSRYNQRCPRREPHISGSFSLIADAGFNATCLQNAVSMASNFSEPSLVDILAQDASSQGPDDASVVLFTMPTSSAEDGTKTALRLESGVYGGQFQAFLMSCGIKDSRTATLENLFVRNPAAKDAGCLPGQYSPEASSACMICERNHITENTELCSFCDRTCHRSRKHQGYC